MTTETESKLNAELAEIKALLGNRQFSEYYVPLLKKIADGLAECALDVAENRTPEMRENARVKRALLVNQIIPALQDRMREILGQLSQK